MDLNANHQNYKNLKKMGKQMVLLYKKELPTKRCGSR